MYEAEDCNVDDMTRTVASDYEEQKGKGEFITKIQGIKDRV